MDEVDLLEPDQVEKLVAERWGAFLAEVNAGVDERDDAGTPLPREFLAQAGTAGLMRFAAPAAIGGDGHRMRLWGRVVQEFARCCEDMTMAGLLSISVSVMHRLADLGRPELIADYAVPVMRGQRYAGIGYSEGADPFSMRTSLVKKGDGFLLTGFKEFISGARLADFYIVYAVDEAGDLVECLVERSDPGVELTPIPSTGLRTQGGASLTFTAVPLAAGRILAGGDGLLQAQQGLTMRRMLHAGLPLGRAQTIYDVTVARLNSQERSGMRLSDLPNVQAIVGQMYIAIQSAQALYHHALDRWDRGLAQPGLDPVASAAKHHSVEQARYVLDRALRVLGGYPILDDLRFGRYQRDLAVFVAVAGTQDLLEVMLGALETAGGAA